MASGFVGVEEDFTFDFDDLSQTVLDLVWRLRGCFRDSDFAKVASILTARENKMKEEIAACNSNVQTWMTRYHQLESRIFDLESDVDLFKRSIEPLGVKLTPETNNEALKADVTNCEEHVDLAAANVGGLALGGSGRASTGNIIEISDSDDEFASGGNPSGKESTSQRVADTAQLDQIELKWTEKLKRKHDSSPSFSKFQKVVNVHHGSPINHGSAMDSNVEEQLNQLQGTLTQCEGGEHAFKNILSDLNDEDISDSSSQLASQQTDEKWEYEIDIINALRKDDELCLKAVCALYRQQISLWTSSRNLSSPSSRGFNHLNVIRGTTLAKFLVDGDPQGKLKKSVSDLKEFDRKGLDDCRSIATDHSKQLMEIYKKKEDPLFLP